MSSIKRKRRPLVLTGQRFGRMVVVKCVGKIESGNYLWECRCDCGNVTKVRGGSLTSGNTKSCGCLGRDHRADSVRKHGMANPKTPEYQSWINMRQRVSNPNHARYDAYGGRGIKVCERWNSFSAFLADMGPRPTPRHSIDRIDNDGDYCPNNCRWATAFTQNNNRRGLRLITVNGNTKTAREWEDYYGWKHSTISGRIRLGWTQELAASTPINPKYGKYSIHKNRSQPH